MGALASSCINASMLSPAEELPSLEEARALQAAEQEQLGHNPRGGLGAKVLVGGTLFQRALGRVAFGTNGGRGGGSTSVRSLHPDSSEKQAPMLPPCRAPPPRLTWQ